jgi:hypothetical protein
MAPRAIAGQNRPGKLRVGAAEFDQLGHARADMTFFSETNPKARA